MTTAPQDTYNGEKLVTLAYYAARENENMKLIIGWFEQFEIRINKKIDELRIELKKEISDTSNRLDERIERLESKMVTVSEYN